MYLQSVCVSCGFWWHDSEKCTLTGGILVPLLVAYLVEQQVLLYNTSRIIEDGAANRTMTILQKNGCIHVYVYLVPSKVCRKVRDCLRHELWYQARKECDRWHNGPSNGNEYTAGYRLILISLYAPLFDVLSDCLSLVCYCIQKCMPENFSF